MKKSEQDGPVNRGEATERAASGEQPQGTEFTAPLGSVKSGRLIFASGASWVTVRADPSLADLYHARFEDRAPRVRAEDGTVTIRYPRFPLRSEERRVGKECRSRWSPYH